MEPRGKICVLENRRSRWQCCSPPCQRLWIRTRCGHSRSNPAKQMETSWVLKKCGTVHIFVLADALKTATHLHTVLLFSPDIHFLGDDGFKRTSYLSHGCYRQNVRPAKPRYHMLMRVSLLEAIQRDRNVRLSTEAIIMNKCIPWRFKIRMESGHVSVQKQCTIPLWKLLCLPKNPGHFRMRAVQNVIAPGYVPSCAPTKLRRKR